MASITFRCDDELKKEFDDILDTLNIKQTDIFINTMKYVVQNQKLPFVIQTCVTTPDDIQRRLLGNLKSAAVLISMYESHRWMPEFHLSIPNTINNIRKALRDYLNIYNDNYEDIKDSPNIQLWESAYNTLVLTMIHMAILCGDAERNDNFDPDDIKKYQETLEQRIKDIVVVLQFK